MLRPSSPCKDCEERHMGCHTTCQQYIDFDVANKSYKLDVYEKKKAIWGNTTEAFQRAIKKKNKNKR